MRCENHVPLTREDAYYCKAPARVRIVGPPLDCGDGHRAAHFCEECASVHLKYKRIRTEPMKTPVLTP